MGKLVSKMPLRQVEIDPSQGELDITVERQIDEDGIGMGVLSDGTPFLNQRGLARLCGVKNKYIGLISSGWNDPQPSRAVQQVRSLLAEQGSIPTEAVHETFFGRVRVLAYPDSVCTAILEYYAFEANLLGQPIALDSYRRLARYGLGRYIYSKTGYNAEPVNDVWQIFKDRVSLTYDSVPEGYFGVFKELSSLIVTLGMNGLHIDEKFVPDISVGRAWSDYWRANRLSQRFGERSTYPHNYPSYFPQAASNPQLAKCYPEDAVGVFRRWFREEYIGVGRFKTYLSRKAGELPAGYVENALLALTKE